MIASDSVEELLDENTSKLFEECEKRRLKSLELSNKKLKSFPIRSYDIKHIQFLYLEKNYLDGLSEDFFPALPLLKWLDVRHNHLRSLPSNIHIAKNLRNLLLEGNQLSHLPFELGLLTSLSGLNLIGNPLVVPPQEVVACGAKVILKYLREQLAIEQKFGKMDLGDAVGDRHRHKTSEDFSDEDTTIPFEAGTNSKKGRKKYHSTKYRRHSLEEEKMTNSPPYSINPLNIKEKRLKQVISPRRRRESPSSAPPNSSRGQKQDRDGVKSDYLRKGAIETTYLHDVEKAEKKAFNEKVDQILQKRKDKSSLDDWRKKTRRLQNHSRMSKSSKKKRELNIPYGNDDQEGQQEISRHAEDVKRVLSQDKISRLKELRDQQLEERIQEHAKHIREWRQKNRLDKMETDLEVAKQNLEKALNLQRDLEEKRALQYRLRAFTAEEFSPPNHGKPK